MYLYVKLRLKLKHEGIANAVNTGFKKSAMQKLRVFTAISQNNCIALFNLVAAAGFEPTTFGL